MQDRNDPDRLVLAVLGTTRHTDASLASTSSPRACTAVLPLGAPLLRDVQHLLHSFLGRLEGIPADLCDGAALYNPASVIIRVVSLVGANFRLLDWLLTLLGGASSLTDWQTWDAGNLHPKGHMGFGSLDSEALLDMPQIHSDS